MFRAMAHEDSAFPLTLLVFVLKLPQNKVRSLWVGHNIPQEGVLTFETKILASACIAWINLESFRLVSASLVFILMPAVKLASDV